MGLIGLKRLDEERSPKGDKDPERFRRYRRSCAFCFGRKLNTDALNSEKATMTRCQSWSVVMICFKVPD